MANQNDNNTKYRFMMEALKLFSEKGYKAVSVAEIAKAVGCSAPALYKHYKNKQELLLAIFEESNKGFVKQMKELENITGDTPDRRQRVAAMTDDDHTKSVIGIVTFALHNEFAQAFRKLCAVEQFHMKELAQIYTYRYFTYQTDYAEKLMQILIEEKVLKPGDAKTYAIAYMSLPILAIGICDREPDREDEMLELVDKHIHEFFRVYRV